MKIENIVILMFFGTLAGGGGPRLAPWWTQVKSGNSSATNCDGLAKYHGWELTAEKVWTNGNGRHIRQRQHRRTRQKKSLDRRDLSEILQKSQARNPSARTRRRGIHKNLGEGRSPRPRKWPLPENNFIFTKWAPLDAIVRHRGRLASAFSAGHRKVRLLRSWNVGGGTATRKMAHGILPVARARYATLLQGKPTYHTAYQRELVLDGAAVVETLWIPRLRSLVSVPPSIGYGRPAHLRSRRPAQTWSASGIGEAAETKNVAGIDEEIVSLKRIR